MFYSMGEWPTNFMKRIASIFILLLSLHSVTNAQTESKTLLLVNSAGNSVTISLPSTVTNNTIVLPGTLGTQGALLYIGSVTSSVGTTTWLNAGTNGYVLSLSGGVPVWTDPSIITTGSAFSFADFYALMPGDNAATIAVGAAVLFPQDGPSSGISRSNNSQFKLPNIGTYEVFFQVSVDEAGQLMLRIDGVELAHSVVGRATGTNQLTGMCLVTTTATNSILEVINPSGNTTALTITPIAGGTHSVSAHLVVKQIK